METGVRSTIYLGICMIFLLGTAPFFPVAAAEKDNASMPKVKGSLKVGKTTVTFNNAVAYRFAIQGAARGEEWSVVHLSDKPFDKAAVAADLKKAGRYSKDFDNQLKLTFNPQGELYYIYFYVREGNVNLNTPPIGVTSHTSFAKGRAAGRVYMQKPQKNFDDEYQFDITFDTDILSH